jgi:hypothetical protein
MNVHPYVLLTTPQGRLVEIDVDLADLVRACWAAGIRTDESCQDFWEDESMVAFLSFPGVAHWRRFATLVTNGGPRDATYDRIIGYRAGDPWDWRVYPVDLSWRTKQQPPDEVPVRAVFLASVLIPAVDLLPRLWTVFGVSGPECVGFAQR